MEHEQTTSTRTPISIEAHCLTLPGRELHLPSLLTTKTFRNRGNKEAALASFRELEDDGLGTLVGENPHYRFIKVTLPEDETERAEFAMSLMKYKVSLVQYSESLNQPEIRTNSKAVKRVLNEEVEVRRSPRKSLRKE